MKEINNLQLANSLELNYLSLLTPLKDDDFLRLPKNLESATQKRKIDFLLGRCCAEIGIPKVGRDVKGRPIWPAGHRGSISHSKDYAAAIRGNSSIIRSIGMDIERIVDEKKLQVIKSSVLNSKEISFLEKFEIQEQFKYATIMFSAKESLYKMINPLTDTYISFSDAEVTRVDLNYLTYDISLLSEKVELKGFKKSYLGSIVSIDNNWLTYTYLKSDDHSQEL